MDRVRIWRKLHQKKEKEDNMGITRPDNELKGNPLSTTGLGTDQEMTPSEGGMKDQDLQEILDKENLELEHVLEQGTNKGIDSLPQEEFDRVQQLFLRRSQTKAVGVKRNHDSQENKGVRQMEITSRYSTKNPGKKRGRRRQNELLS